MTDVPELQKQNAKFGYKAPETVYKKHDPKSTMVGQGKAFQGVGPMDFFMRQNAQKKAVRAKEQEEKQKLYKNDLMKSAFL